MFPTGSSLPKDDIHAVSVSLPRWQDVVDYEECKDELLNKLQVSYPRFCYHPLVSKLQKHYCKLYGRSACCIFISLRSAHQFLYYLGLQDNIVRSQEGLYVVFYTQDLQAKAKEFWQHTGLGISSRLAQAVLNGEKLWLDSKEHYVKAQLAELYDCASDDIYLCSSGMSSIYYLHKYLLDCYPKNGTMQFGFPYLDTLKIQQKFGYQSIFVSYSSDSDFLRLEQEVLDNKISAIFCEFPTNPLLNSIDLEKLYYFTRQHNILFIIDDTLVTVYNANLLCYADALVTSLTKFFSGYGNVMLGSMILNSESNHYQSLKAYFNDNYDHNVFYKDVDILADNCCDFTDRMSIINYNTEKLCDYLACSDKIAKIHYPKYVNRDIYNRVIGKNHGHYGGVFSVEFYDKQNAEIFYDACQIAKGPSLGNCFTMMCPYTLLAHYHELDWVKQYGISSHLIRISVGIEEFDEILDIFSKALSLL